MHLCGVVAGDIGATDVQPDPTGSDDATAPGLTGIDHVPLALPEWTA